MHEKLVDNERWIGGNAFHSRGKWLKYWYHVVEMDGTQFPILVEDVESERKVMWLTTLNEPDRYLTSNTLGLVLGSILVVIYDCQLLLWTPDYILTFKHHSSRKIKSTDFICSMWVVCVYTNVCIIISLVRFKEKQLSPVTTYNFKVNNNSNVKKKRIS